MKLLYQNIAAGTKTKCHWNSDLAAIFRKSAPVLPQATVCGKLISFSVGDDIGVSDMCMMDEIIAKRDEIYAIARKHKAEKLWVFGSCARREMVA